MRDEELVGEQWRAGRGRLQEASLDHQGIGGGCRIQRKRGVRDDLFSLELSAGGSGKEHSCEKSRFLE